jgi:hypothetical protein
MVEGSFIYVSVLDSLFVVFVVVSLVSYKDILILRPFKKVFVVLEVSKELVRTFLVNSIEGGFTIFTRS